MSNFIILKKGFFMKNKESISKMGGGAYLSNKYMIYCNNLYKEDPSYDEEVIEILERIISSVKIAEKNIFIDSENPQVFKKNLNSIIKINKQFVKQLISKYNKFKYFPELNTVIALFFIRDDKFIFYHSEYLCNIRKFIERKYFGNFRMISSGHRDDEAIAISYKIYNKYILESLSAKTFFEYLIDELKTYLSFRNSYNIKIREMKRKMMYNNDFNNMNKFNNKQLFDISSGSKYYTEHINRIEANEIISFLKEEKLVPDNTNINNIMDYLNDDMIKIIKNKYYIKEDLNG